MHLDPLIRVRPQAQDVVIAPYKMDVFCWDRLLPSCEQRVLKVFSAMEQVARNDDGFGLEVLYLHHQAMQIFQIDLRRDGYPRFTEMTGLPKMQVG